jgi:hypothetical protein
MADAARLAELRPRLVELATAPAPEREARLRAWAAQHPLPPAALGLEEDDLRVLGCLVEYGEALTSKADLEAVQPDATPERLHWLAELGCLRTGGRTDEAPTLTPLGRLVTT